MHRDVINFVAVTRCVAFLSGKKEKMILTYAFG